MALDATAGGAGANSYLTVAEADAFAAEHIDGAAWLALADDATKEPYLITASRDMNGICLTGTASTATQALAVPRTGWTYGGQAVSITVVPTLWKWAVFEYALSLVRAVAARRERDQSVEGLTKLKVGSIELGFKADIELKDLPDHVRRILPAEWLCDDGQVYFDFKVL